MKPKKERNYEPDHLRSVGRYRERTLETGTYSLIGLLRKTSQQPRRAESLHYGAEAHTIINPGFFADAYLATIGLAAHLGVFPWMYGNSRNAPPSSEDIARVVVATLIDLISSIGIPLRSSVTGTS